MIEINDECMILAVDGKVIATARFSRHAAASGKGAWIVHLDFFKRLTTRFENLERAIVIAERVAALKQINMLATRRRTKRR